MDIHEINIRWDILFKLHVGKVCALCFGVRAAVVETQAILSETRGVEMTKVYLYVAPIYYMYTARCQFSQNDRQGP